MKQLLQCAALAGILLPASAGAQQAKTYEQPFRHALVASNFNKHVEQAGHSGRARKTTADNASRLIALADMSHDGTAYVPEDSTTASYSGGRGGFVVNGEGDIDYDVANTYRYDIGTGTYSLQWKSSQTFDANNNILTGLSQEWHAISGTWRNVMQDIYTYDGMNNQVTYLYQQWDTTAGIWINLDKSTSTYVPGTNRIATETHESWNGTTGAWENYYRLSTHYNATNKPDTVFNDWWDGAAWVVQTREIRTYDAAGLLLSEGNEQWDLPSTAWEPNYRTTYTYDASNNIATEVNEYWDVMAGAWASGAKTIYSSYTGASAGQQIRQDWDGATSALVNSSRITTTFNSFVQPSYEEEDSWDAAGGVWVKAGARRFYYETYVTAVQDAVALNGKVALYPVPATSSVTLDIALDEAQAFTVSLADVRGRVYMTETLAGRKQYKEDISTANMPEGNYFVTVTAASGKTVKQLTIVK